VLSELHRKDRESVTLQATYGEAGSVNATFWLRGGKSRVVKIDSEGRTSGRLG
jgi:hypothetical protein